MVVADDPRLSAPVDQGRAGAFGLWLLAALILIQFFTIPALPGVNLAPENFVFLAAILAFGPKLARLAFASGRLSAAVLALLGFSLLAWLHDLTSGGLVGSPGRHMRAAVYILLLAHVCSYPVTRRQVMSLVVLVGVAQVIFASLVYFIGEPFMAIRAWMLQTAESGDTVIGRGSQIAGTYGAPHVFSYLLASFPFLAISLFLREKKVVWLGALIVLVLGLFLNAERSSAAVFFVGIFYLAIKTRQRTRNLTLLGVVLLALIGMQQIIGSQAPATGPGAASESSYTHGTLADRLGGTSVDEVMDRIMYQAHGITSVFKHPLLGPTQLQYAREVAGEGGAVISGALAAAVMAPHNHYIDIGVHAGLGGWLLFLVCAWSLWKAQRTVKIAVRITRTAAQQEYLYVSAGLLAAMGNALFHNAGIFSPELATSTMVGLLLAQYRQVVCQPVRRPLAPPTPVDAGPINGVGGTSA